MLTGASRELTTLCISPVYGSSNAYGSHVLTLDIGILLWALTMLSLFPSIRTFTLAQLISVVSILGCSIPSITSYLYQYSGTLGPHWGPLVSMLFTTAPLSCLSSFYIAFFMSQQTASEDASSLPINNFVIFNAVAYVTILASQTITHELLQWTADIASLHIGRYGLQIILTGFFATMNRSKVLFITLPLVCFAMLNMHILVPSNISRLNANLGGTSYAIVDRQESITGYISVLDNLEQGFRVLRCDHSLLGGEWTRYPPGYMPKLKEPIYAIFVMLEAVRLVQTDKLDLVLKEPDHQKRALFM